MVLISILKNNRISNTLDTIVHSSLPSKFMITMAPIAQSLENNVDGLGGFKYTDLMNTNFKNRISYFNTQFYNYDAFYEYDDFFLNN